MVWWGEDDADGLTGDELEIFGQRLAADGREIGKDDFRVSRAGADGDPRFAALVPSVAYRSADRDLRPQSRTPAEAAGLLRRPIGVGRDGGVTAPARGTGGPGSPGPPGLCRSLELFLSVQSGALDPDVGPGIDERLVPVLPADSTALVARLAQHLDDLAAPRSLAHPMSLHDDPVPRVKPLARVPRHGSLLPSRWPGHPARPRFGSHREGGHSLFGELLIVGSSPQAGSVALRMAADLQSATMDGVFENATAEPSTIRRRDGTVVPFDRARIAAAVLRATREVGRPDPALTQTVAARVSEDVSRRFGSAAPGVEDVQDAVERLLLEAGRVEVARAYGAYRTRRAELRSTKGGSASAMSSS